ncbi:MAG: hypothetical protein JRN61_00705 [Nitrososphaerota archaeon]|nr:hypothetical protein [Nitrososphaerota archaeon]MDG7047484.1 hypothetical protein [Nitrososphaerota archaeon]
MIEFTPVKVPPMKHLTYVRYASLNQEIGSLQADKIARRIVLRKAHALES